MDAPEVALSARIKMKKARLPNIAMLVADTVPAMIWASDTNALRTYFNRSWLEFTGKTLTEELGDGWANESIRTTASVAWIHFDLR